MRDTSVERMTALGKASARARQSPVWVFPFSYYDAPVARFESCAQAGAWSGLKSKTAQQPNARTAGANIAAACIHRSRPYGYNWRKEDARGFVDLAGLIEQTTGKWHGKDYRRYVSASELSKRLPKAASSPVARVLAPTIDDFA